MNIFYLDKSPKLAAEYHCDKHILKMVIEYAQMLSTAHRTLDGNEAGDSLGLYRSTHMNHPCSIWVRQGSANYMFLYDLMRECLSQYTIRYEKIHATSRLLEALSNPPKNIAKTENITQLPQAMPEEYQVEGDSVSAYRNFYNYDKSRFAVWKNTNVPYWFKIIQENETTSVNV